MHPQWLLGRRRPPPGLGQASGSLLDIGAADRWLEPFVRPHARYVSLDYPATGARLYGARPHVFADAASLPFADASFDAVTCLEVLEHVGDPVAVMHEIARVLKPGGRLWLSMPFLYPVHDAPHDYQRFTEHGHVREMQRVGLEVVGMQRNARAIRAAGLLACLALAGGISSSRRAIGLVLLPLALPAILAVNLSAWVVGAFWPDWNAMTVGYEVEARKT